MYSNFYSNPYQVVRVNGENGARMYQLPPNSSALLIDENEPLVYLVTTDGAGYKTISTYSIKPYEPEPMPDYNSLNSRLERLESIINESYAAKPKQKQPNKSNYADKEDA